MIQNAEKAPPSPESPLTAGRFALIDAIRGIAALAITLHHLHRYGPLPRAADRILPSWTFWIFDLGWIAVTFFFVIAGFVAAYSLRNARITPLFAGRFILRRVIRLGIPYWFIVILIHALSFWSMHMHEEESLVRELTSSQTLAQFFFLQDILGYGNVSAGMWFIAIDLQFGLLFILLLCVSEGVSGGWLTHDGTVHSRPSRGGLLDQITLLAAILPAALYSLFFANRDPSQDMWVWYFFHAPALGALAWWVLEKRIRPAGFWLLVVAMIVELFLCWRKKLLITVIAGVLLYVAGKAGKLDLLRYQPLQYLGRISYSLFLIHYPVSCLVLNLGYYLTGDRPVAAVAWEIASLLASLAAAHLLYVFIETPGNRLARRLKA